MSSASGIANVLTIAGSDSGGGAGIQADLKTFSALGTYGASVITAITAQNTRAVTAIHAVPVEVIVAQIDAVLEDIDIAAVKVGMLGTAAIIEAVASAIERHGAKNVVVDPVMVAKSGDRLLAPDAVETLRRRLVVEADLLTPNLPEAGDLLGRPAPADEAEMAQAGRALVAAGAKAVLVKGGHLGGEESVDLLVDAEGVLRLPAPRTETSNTHGTGCSLSSAIAAFLARGVPLREAVVEAKRWLTGAIAAAGALSVGRGHGPVHHFHALW